MSELYDLVAALASSFPGYQPFGYGCLVYLETPGLANRIKFWQQRDSLPVEVTGVYPEGCTPADAPRITLDPQRPVAELAADLQQRFLPSYLAQLARMQAPALARLAAILDTDPPDGATGRLYWRAGASTWACVKVQAPDSIAIEMRHLPLDLAVAVCQVLQKHHDQRR